MDERLLRVLDDREKRWNRRKELASKGGFASLVTITVCLPVAYRADPANESLFRALCREYTRLLDEQGWEWSQEDFMTGEDGPACFIAVQQEPKKVKAFSVEAEQQIPGGRMLDIDLMDSNGIPVGREALGLPPRGCFVCEQPAAVCVSRKIHKPEDVARKAEALLYEAKKYFG